MAQEGANRFRHAQRPRDSAGPTSKPCAPAWSSPPSCSTALQATLREQDQPELSLPHLACSLTGAPESQNRGVKSSRARPRRGSSAKVVHQQPRQRGCSSMAERQLPKLHTRVRFPSPAPHEGPSVLLVTPPAPIGRFLRTTHEVHYLARKARDKKPSAIGDVASWICRPDCNNRRIWSCPWVTSSSTSSNMVLFPASHH
jgi:hypothetical protein